MSDFTYDSEDLSAVRVSFKNLQETEMRSFYIGLIGSAFFGLAAVRMSRRFNGPFANGMSWKLGAFSLFSGSVLYSCLTIGAKMDYNKATAILNRKYSTITSKVLDYE